MVVSVVWPRLMTNRVASPVLDLGGGENDSEQVKAIHRVIETPIVARVQEPHKPATFNIGA